MCAQYIKQGNIFGRIGTELGKGLAESIPKEVERNRLSSGLKELNQQKGLSPQEYFTQALGVPGLIDRPQAVQSLAQLAREQGIRNSYANMGKGERQPPSQQASPDLKSMQFANMSQNQRQQATNEIPEGDYPEGTAVINPKNPLADELQPRIRFTPEQYYDVVARIGSQNPHLTNPEIQELAKQEEQRYIQAPEDYQAQQKYLEDQEENINNEIDSQIRTKLHIPKDEEIFSKLPGETLNRIQRGVVKDLRSNPDANKKDLVNTWTNRALQNEKAKSQLKKIANRDWSEKIFKSGENLDKLRDIGKSFKEFGNSPEYYNILQSDFGTSPEGSASIAYELSPQAKKYVGNIKESNAANFNKNSIKYANELGDYLTKGDSILSIAKNIKERDPFFEIKTFLSEVRNIQDELGLTGQQKLEINERGISDVFPNWGDIFLFPKMGKGK